jgi:hypothetical protein
MTVDAANAANPFSAQNMAKVDTTRPGHYVSDASGNPVALTNYSPGFNINNPTALTYLGELSAKPYKKLRLNGSNKTQPQNKKPKPLTCGLKKKLALTHLTLQKLQQVWLTSTKTRIFN